MDVKDLVARAIYFNRTGPGDYLTWSKKMFEYYGPDIGRHIRAVRKWSIAIEKSLDGHGAPRLNCWEFMGCGTDGKQIPVHEGIARRRCPAFLEESFDGVHGGSNGGRACWIISHTTCCGTTQGTHEEKYQDCLSCDFYRSVAEEEDELMSPRELKELLV